MATTHHCLGGCPKMPKVRKSKIEFELWDKGNLLDSPSGAFYYYVPKLYIQCIIKEISKDNIIKIKNLKIRRIK